MPSRDELDRHRGDVAYRCRDRSRPRAAGEGIDLLYSGRAPGYGMDFSQFEGIVENHVDWLRKAAATDRGVLVFWSI